jgi:hypothetical protein
VLLVFGGIRVAHLFSFHCGVLFVFVLCFVYPKLPVSLDYPFLIALSVLSNVYSPAVVLVNDMTSQSRIHGLSFMFTYPNIFVVVNSSFGPDR